MRVRGTERFSFRLLIELFRRHFSLGLKRAILILLTDLQNASKTNCYLRNITIRYTRVLNWREDKVSQETEETLEFKNRGMRGMSETNNL